MKSYKRILRGIFIISTVIFILITLPASNAVAASEGPRNAGDGSNQSTIGTVPWVDPGNITSPGSPYASISLRRLVISNYLAGTQFGFNLPLDTAISGIEVVVNRYAQAPTTSVSDYEVRILKAGQPVGDNKATATPWPNTLTAATYGGPTDLWGTTWTPAEINANNFGAAVSAQRDNNGNNERLAYVDTIQITVYYGYTSTTEVACGSGDPIAYGENISCTATVTSINGTTPTGTVTWTTDSSGAFDPNPCNLGGSGGIASCTTTYTPSAVGDGSHLVTADYRGDTYYTPSNGSQSVTVNTRPVTVTADPQTKVYGEPDPALTYQITAGSLVFSDTFTGTLTRDPGEDVGSYAILQGTLALSENYNLTYEGADLTITARAVEVTADPQTKVYGDEDPEFTYQVTSGSLVPGDEFSGALTRDPGEDVGTYAILQGTLALTDNYNLTYVGADLTITPRLVEVTADAQAKVYGDADPEFTYQVTSGSLVPGDVFTGALARDPGEDVGVYAILQGTLALSDNYTLSYVGADLTVTPRLVEVTADAQTKEYGDPDPEFTYQVTSGSLVPGDEFSGALSRVAGEDMGSYAIQQGTLALSDNYDLSFVGADLAITPRPIEVTADAKAKVYGDPDPELTYQITSGALAFGDEFTGALTREPGEGVGTYAILQGTLALSANYDLTYVGNYLTIGLYSITVTADAQAKVYGDVDPVLTYQITEGELQPGDEFSGELSRVAGEDVGVYAITQGTLSLPEYYALLFIGDDLTIAPRAVEVTADAQAKVYGEPDPELTYQVTSGSLVPGDEFSGSLTRNPGEDVGSYAILQGTLALSENYDLTYVSADLIITPREIEVTADAQFKEYGDPDPELTYQVTSGSLVPGDEFSGALDRESGEDIGTYAIIQGTLALSDNYDLTFVSADLTITLRQVTVAADDKNKDYGQPDPELTYQVTAGSLLSGDTFSGSLTRQPGENIRTYAILQGTLSLPDYYDLTYMGATFTINGSRWLFPILLRAP